MTLIRNKATEEGRALGRELARICDNSEPAARLKFPELPPRCASCAFREGKHVANGSQRTTMDAVKCVLEGILFLCHEPSRDGAVCSGYAIMMLSNDTNGSFKAPWPFSDEAECP